MNLNSWNFGTPCELDAWVKYLKGKNPVLGYWNDRWSEQNRGWGNVLFPVDESVRDTVGLLPGGPYQGVPILAYDQLKWADARDFFNKMLVDMTEEIVANIRSVDRKAIIGQRIDLWRYGDFRQETWNNPGIDFYFYSGYPESEDEARTYTEPLKSRLIYFSQFASKPIYLWEAGTVPGDPDENVLSKVVTAVIGEFSDKTDIIGYSFWTWRDDYMPGYQDIGLITVDGQDKAALKETEKLFQQFGFITARQSRMWDGPLHMFKSPPIGADLSEEYEKYFV